MGAPGGLWNGKMSAPLPGGEGRAVSIHPSGYGSGCSSFTYSLLQRHFDDPISREAGDLRTDRRDGLVPQRSQKVRFHRLEDLVLLGEPRRAERLAQALGGRKTKQALAGGATRRLIPRAKLQQSGNQPPHADLRADRERLPQAPLDDRTLGPLECGL